MPDPGSCSGSRRSPDKHFDNFIVDIEDRIAVVKVARPQVLNALSSDLLKEADVLLDSLQDEVDVIVLTGEGRAFVAGADIEEMRGLSAEQGRRFGQLGARLFRRIERMPQPVIAAVNGFALGGGCELALACDIRIASEKAKFGQPEVTLGIIPGFSGTQRLPRIVGAAKAKELILTGALIDAAEALRIGLVSRVVPGEELLPACMDLARQIARNAQVAVRYGKAAINAGLGTDLETGIALEQDLFGLCFATEDQKEGMAAFLEKRRPAFRGY
jgi:enoyl-CoA hydratase